MENISRQVWAEIDLDSFEYNVKNIKKLAGNRDVIAVIKADAYGHGALGLINSLRKCNVSKFAVAVISEALELRRNDVNESIMILGFTPLDYAEDLINNNIEATVYSYDYAKQLSETALKLGKKAKIHIAIDTGMGRIGFLPNNESVNDVIKISKLSGISIEGMFTHFATADEEDKTYTYEQYEKYTWFADELNKAGVTIKMKDVSNSAAIMELPETYNDAVRAGIILYGYYPSDEVDKSKIDLKNVLTLKTKVCHVKEIEKGSYVSYGRKFKAERNTIIATIPIGYADGYSRSLSNKVKVIINGKFAKQVGRICMDQCMIDVTDIGEVKVGDEVILLGSYGDLKYDADDMTKDLDTISYEVLCMISKRIPRVYIRNNKIVDVRNYI